ncbi:MAG: hypothetical protein V4628_08160 [Pseudomonadota bacterium]
MNKFRAIPAITSKFPALRFSFRLLILAMLPVLVAAQNEPAADEHDPALDPQDTNSTNSTATPHDTHASQQASDDLLIMAAHEPEKLIGKTLILDDGTDAKTVGPVLDIRRRLQDLELYLIVDAMQYFNSAGEYAVAVRDVDRIEADTLIIPEAPGMHLRGLDYYPDDYTGIEDTLPADAAVDEQ